MEGRDFAPHPRSVQPPESESTLQMKIVGGVPGAYLYEVNGVKVVKCPFNPSHIMRAKRLQYHLVKCLKTYQGQKVRCPYNAQEYVDREDFEAHLKVCRSKSALLAHAADYEKTLKEYPELEIIPIQNTVPYTLDQSEMW